MTATASNGTPPVPSKITSRSVWAEALLVLIGAPVTQNNIANIVSWESAEGGAGPQFGVSGNVTNYNPLNVAFPQADYSSPANVYGGSPTTGNGNVPVASFPDWGSGLAATAARIKQPFAGAILRSLQADAPIGQLSSAVAGSGWGTGNFSAGGDAQATGGGGTVTLTGAQAGGTATQTSSTSSDNIAGVPDGFPTTPDASANPITDLQRTVQWFGELIGWAFLITLVFLFGMVLVILGTVLLVMILAGPAIGPVTAAVGGKSPEGRVIAGVAGTINKGREKKKADREYDEDVRAAGLGSTPKSRRAADKEAEATGYREGFGTRGPAADSRPSTGGRVRLSDGSWF